MDPPTHILLALDSTFGSSISEEKLKSEQSADPECQALLSDLPVNFVVRNNIIYKVAKTNSFLPFIPKSLRLKVLEYFHDHPHSGHMGYRKTLKRLCSRV